MIKDRAIERRTLLLVEDSDDDRALVRKLLGQSPRPYKITECASGEEAVALLAKGARFDCVLIDCRLPDLDGVALLRRIRSDLAIGPPLAAAMLTGGDDDRIAIEALSAGAEDFLLKDSLTAKGLARSIENVIEKADIRLQLERERAAAELRNQRLENLHTELQVRLDELAAARQARDRFTAMMSHEMRTPLNVILGYTELLELEIDGGLSAGQRRSMARIRVGSTHLLSLINDVLDLARADAHMLELDLRAVDVVAVLEEVSALMANDAAQRKLALQIRASEPLPFAHADPQRLRQIVINLVGNALKFTESGSVTLSADVDDTGDIVVSVTDTGIGIDQASLALVFHEFFQVDNGLTRQRGGSGLGLAISSRLANAMHGTLSATSEPDVGSRFALHLPPAASDSTAGLKDT